MDVAVITSNQARQGASCPVFRWGWAFQLGRATPVVDARFRPMSTSIDVVINGQPRTVNAGTTISVLLGDLGLGDRKVAVERNREVVPRALHATTTLADGDRLEVVTFVGGG